MSLTRKLVTTTTKSVVSTSSSSTVAVGAQRGGFDFLSDKTPVVLDIGAAYTRCGVAGELTPRHVIRSTVDIDGQTYAVHDLEGTRSNALNDDILYEFLFDVFYKRLMVKTQECRAVIVENMVVSEKFRRRLVTVLFKEFRISSVCHVPVPQLTLYPFARTTALIIDFGFTETRCTAVVEGTTIISTLHHIAPGARDVLDHLKKLLKEHAKVSKTTASLSDVVDELSTSVLEDILIRCCFGCHPPALVKASTVRYRLPGGPVLEIPHDVRIHTADILFECGDFGESVAHCTLRSLLSCPVDSRKELASNIILAGGLANLTGLASRFLSEIKTACQKDPEFKKLNGEERSEWVVTVSVEREGGQLDAYTLEVDTEYIKLFLAAKLSSSGAVDDFKLEYIQGNSAKATLCFDHDVDITDMDNFQISGGHMYKVTKAEKQVNQRNSGVGNAFAVHAPQADGQHLPPHVLSWVGASLIGRLGGLEYPLVLDTYNEAVPVPHWTSIVQEERDKYYHKKLPLSVQLPNPRHSMTRRHKLPATPGSLPQGRAMPRTYAAGAKPAADRGATSALEQLRAKMKTRSTQPEGAAGSGTSGVSYRLDRILGRQGDQERGVPLRSEASSTESRTATQSSSSAKVGRASAALAALREHQVRRSGAATKEGSGGESGSSSNASSRPSSSSSASSQGRKRESTQELLARLQNMLNKPK